MPVPESVPESVSEPASASEPVPASPVPADERVHPLEFGITLNPEAARIDELIRLARLADNRGFELLGLMGGPRRSPKAAIDALDEAVAVIRRVWAAGDTPAAYEGEHYRLEGVVPGPAPAHPIGIRPGAYRPRMLEVTGRRGDGRQPSFPYLDPAGIIALNKQMADHDRQIETFHAEAAPAVREAVSKEGAAR